jgi:hypothetical protein
MSPRPRTRAVRRPTDRPSRALKAVVDENVARMNVIDGLYQPIREAADAELGKIEAGRKLLKDQRALVKRLRQLRARVDTGDLTAFEARRTSHELRQRFGLEHRDTYLRAYSRQARLSPSAEAIGDVLHPVRSGESRPVWKAEIAAFESLLLAPKSEEADDVGTVRQGLEDPEPPPAVDVCLRPPFARETTGHWSTLNGAALKEARPALGNTYGFAVVAGAGGAAALALVGGTWPSRPTSESSRRRSTSRPPTAAPPPPCSAP